MAAGFGDVLRGLGSVLNPAVAQGLQQEGLINAQGDERMQQLMLAQVIKGVESGSIDPAKLQGTPLAGMVAPNPAIARDAKSQAALMAMPPADRADPAKVRAVLEPFMSAHDVYTNLNKNPLEGLPEIAKLQMLSAKYRASGNTAAADQIDAQIKKNSQTEGSAGQEGMNYILDVRRRMAAGQNVTQDEIDKATFYYKTLTTPKIDLATGASYQPDYGQGFDPTRNFGITQRQNFPDDESARNAALAAAAAGKQFSFSVGQPSPMPNVQPQGSPSAMPSAAPQGAPVAMPNGIYTPKAPPDPNALGTPAKNDIEKDLLTVTQRSMALNAIKTSFKPEFQTLQTRWSTLYTDAKDKVGFEPSPEDSKQLKEYSTFKQNAIANLNQYIKDMTGAAMGIQEAERLTKAVPNPGQGLFDGDGPTAFKQKLDTAIEMAMKVQARLTYAKRNGVSVLDEKGEPRIPLEQMPMVMNDFGKNAEAVLKQNNPNTPIAEIRKRVAIEIAKEFGLGQ